MRGVCWAGGPARHRPPYHRIERYAAAGERSGEGVVPALDFDAAAFPAVRRRAALAEVAARRWQQRRAPATAAAAALVAEISTPPHNHCTLCFLLPRSAFALTAHEACAYPKPDPCRLLLRMGL